jgi:hypothetical protein
MPRLLVLLERLQQLQKLTLLNIDADWPPATAAYSALTASSNLVSLSLVSCALPAGIWQHLFSSSRPLPLFTFLHTDWYDVRPSAPAFGSADVRSIVAACPALEDLQIAIEPDVQLSPLLELQSLSCLELGSTELKGVMPTIAALRVLKSLSLMGTGYKGLSLEMLTSLTVLAELTALHCVAYNAWGVPEGAENEEAMESFYLASEVSSECLRCDRRLHVMAEQC